MKHLRNFIRFTKNFGIYSNAHVLVLVLGGVLLSGLEILGLAALFPLLNLILVPGQIDHNPFIQHFSNLTGVTGHGKLTMVVGLMIAGIFVIKNFLTVLYLRYEFNVLTAWRIHIISTLYRVYMNADYERFMNRNSAEMISVITGIVPTVINNYVHKVITLLNCLMTGAVILGFVLYVNWMIATLVFAAGYLIVRLYSRVFKSAARTLGQQAQELGQSQHSLLQQSFAGYKETKSHLKEEFFSGKFLANSEKLAKTEGKLYFIENLPPATVEIVIMVLLIIVFEMIVFTGSNIENATAQVGTIVLASLRLIPVINRTIASVVMMNSAAQPVEELLNEVQWFGLTSADFKMSARREEKREGIVTPMSFRSGLVMTGLSYQYAHTDRLALNQIDFAIKPGEFVGITGPSGSGKSTLINILLGFLSSYKGGFTVDGVPVTQENIKALRKIIGFVDQQTFILDASIAENIAYGTDREQIDRTRVIEALKKAQLWDFVESMPQGIDSHVGENGKLLSGGQRQRIAIARAFYRDLKLLILDEASASLDVETEHRFFEFLKSLKGELAVIMIAHRLSTLKDCSRIVFIDAGHTVDSGSFDELYRSNEKFRSYIEYSQITISKADV